MIKWWRRRQRKLQSDARMAVYNALSMTEWKVSDDVLHDSGLRMGRFHQAIDQMIEQGTIFEDWQYYDLYHEHRIKVYKLRGPKDG